MIHKLLQICDKRTTIPDALKKADEVLQQGVQGVTDLIQSPGIINLDFADIQSVMRDKGIAHIGIGRGSGEDKAVEAIKQAMESPLLETTVSGATDIIINFAGNIGMIEAYDAVNYLTEAAGDEVNIIFGTVDNETMGDEVSITIIATGIEAAAKKTYGNFAQSSMPAFTKPVQSQAAQPASTPVTPAASPVQPVQQTVQPLQNQVAAQSSATQFNQQPGYRQPGANQGVNNQGGFAQGSQQTPTYGGQPVATPQPKTAPKPSFLSGAQGSAANTGVQATPVTTARPQAPRQEADGSIKIPEFLKRR